MTNKEAIKRLKEVQAEFNENWVDYGGVNQAFELAIKALENERPQGVWIKNAENWDYINPPFLCKCSFCGHILSFMNYYPKSNFCPNCGAKMKK